MEHSFCCHFSNALIHYQLLIQLVEAEMMHMTNGLQASAGNFNPNVAPVSASVTALDDPVRADEILSEGKAPTPDEKSPIDGCHYHNAHSPLTFSTSNLPSDYLQSRCPCCFGGSSARASGLLV